MNRATLRLTTLFVAIPSLLHGADYNVGPGKTHESINNVPWESLSPGDRVMIHWRKTPYAEKWVICRQGTAEKPIRIVGVPGPKGQLPVIDGRNATTRKALNFWNEERGVIKIGGANRPADTMPAHIVIENLDIRSGRPPFGFTGRHGKSRYKKNAAAVYVEKGEHVTIRGCVLHDSGNGLVVSPQSSDILVENCYLYDNGIENSIYEHNSYTEAAGIVFQGNRYGPLRKGCLGNNLKDRSAGLVVRYNWIEGGNRQLDLVDATGKEKLRDDPRYRKTFVYGNVLIEHDGHGNSQIVHYGGDSGKTEWYRHGTLYFYNNTVVSYRKGTTTLLRLSSAKEHVDCRNNIVYVTSSGRHLALMVTDGTLQLERNWFKPGYRPSHSGFSGTIRGGEGSLTGTVPGFRDPEKGDFRLLGTSPCIGAGANLHPDVPPEHRIVRQYVPHQKTRTRQKRGAHDLGAFGHASTEE